MLIQQIKISVRARVGMSSKRVFTGRLTACSLFCFTASKSIQLKKFSSLLPLGRKRKLAADVARPLGKMGGSWRIFRYVEQQCLWILLRLSGKCLVPDWIDAFCVLMQSCDASHMQPLCAIVFLQAVAFSKLQDNSGDGLLPCQQG